MLHSLEHLRKYSLVNAEIQERTGSISDVLLDDHDFVARYLVVDTGDWLPGRKVLVAPEAISGADWQANRLFTDLTKKQIEQSPPLSTDAPVSQAYRRDLALYYGWSAYTAYHPVVGGYGPIGVAGSPPINEAQDNEASATDAHLAEDSSETPSLRSIREITGYDIHGTDEGVGHLEDMIVDTSGWAIRYLVVDTVNWLPFTKKVLIPTPLLRDISFADRRVSVDLTKEQIKDSPEFDPTVPINTAHEFELFDCYGRRHVG